MNKFFAFILSVFSFAAMGQGLLNDKAFIVISSGTTVTIVDGSARGNFTNQNTANTLIDGDLVLQGNFTNTATFNSTSGNVIFNGTVNQTIFGNSTAFYDLVENNSSGLTIDSIPSKVISIKNQFSMTQGIINLKSNEIVLGVSGAIPGILSHSAGWMHGSGKFTRWIENTGMSIPIGNVGFFPMGSSSNYHPFWFGSLATLTHDGTMSISHTPSNSGNTAITQYTDNSWGNNVVAISNAAWIVSTDNSFNINPSGVIRFGGDGFMPFVLTDINASLVSNTFGDYLPTTGTGTYFEVNRESIDYANLNTKWYIGTKNTTNTPLPIDLIFFKGSCNNGKVGLTWSTASESNNDFFTIERSLDAINWINMAMIPGAGNSNQTHNYTYSDENTVDYAMYYRLKQTDFDGNVKTFAPVSVNCASSEDIEVNVFPNPFKEEVTLDISNFGFSNAQVNVFDIIGNKIAERTFTDIQNHAFLTTFDLGSLACGMYYFEIRSAGFTKNIKIVKN
jgi:hypothetical protein